MSDTGETPVLRLDSTTAAHQLVKERLPVHAMCRVVRAGVDATRVRVFAEALIITQVAHRGLSPLAGLLFARDGVLEVHRERVHVDVAVRALLGTPPAADA